VRCPRSETTHGQTGAGSSFLVARYLKLPPVTPEARMIPVATVLVLFVMFAAMV
jgi:hypothetical protein